MEAKPITPLTGQDGSGNLCGQSVHPLAELKHELDHFVVAGDELLQHLRQLARWRRREPLRQLDLRVADGLHSIKDPVQRGDHRLLSAFPAIYTLFQCHAYQLSLPKTYSGQSPFCRLFMSRFRPNQD